MACALFVWRKTCAPELGAIVREMLPPTEMLSMRLASNNWIGYVHLFWSVTVYAAAGAAAASSAASATSVEHARTIASTMER